MNFSGKRVLVAGLGDTGVSLLSFLCAQGAIVAGFDAKLNEATKVRVFAQFPEVDLLSGSLDAALEQNYDVLALSPGVPSSMPCIKAFAAKGKQVIGDVEIFASLVKTTSSRVIAITGSNGKSTVTSLVGHLCQSAGLNTVIAGNIGLPVLDAWQAQIGKPVDVWVLELSSFQLDTTYSLHADAACVLNISEDHLDRYTDLLDYAHSKSKVFNGSGVQVLNADDVFCLAMARPNRTIKYFSLLQPADFWVNIQQWDLPLMSNDQEIVQAASLPLQGLHNAANILAAFALCEAIGLDRATLLKVLPNFKGLPHRVEKVGEKQGILFIDDSKGTNVGATCAAIAGFVDPVVLIAGGDGKGQDFSPLKEALNNKTRAVFLIGRDATLIKNACDGLDVPFVFCQSLEEATQKAFECAQKGDVVLLSPACASWDMFQNYSHRAQVFIDAFQSL